MDAHGRRSKHPRIIWLAVSIALGVAAFWVIAQAYDLTVSWGEDREPGDGIRLLHWVGVLALYAFGGFLGTLALRPPRSMRYRALRPLVASVAPILLIAHSMAWFSGWVMPGFLRFVRFYASLDVQIALAVFVGVAVATGFEDVVARPRQNVRESQS